MGTEQLVIVALILFFSSLTQAMIGFAFNLIAIPLLIWSGLSLAEAVVLTSIPIFVQLSTNLFKLHNDVVWDDITAPVVIRYMSLPIGVWLLYYVDSLDTPYIKQLVGVMLLLILLTQIFASFKPREHLHFFWSVLAFGMSGIMLGALGMGGPAIVLWLMAHQWEPRRTRAFITVVFLFGSPIQIALLYWKFGSDLSHAFLWGIMAAPLVILAALVGVRIGDKFDKVKLKKMVMLFLFLTAILSIFSPYLHK